MNLQFGRALALAALVWAGGVQAADGVPTAKTGLEQVQAQKRAAYESVLAQFDRAVAAAPDDASIGVARCEYIGNFIEQESGEYIEGAFEDYEACGTWLRSRWAKAQAVQLFELEQLWGDEAIARGEALGDAIDAWPKPLRMRALSHLSHAYSGTDDAMSGAFAVEAAKLGDLESLGSAISHLVARRRSDEATRLLDASGVPDSAWAATSIVRAALVLPDKQAAWRTVQRFERSQVEDLGVAVAAAAQWRAGDTAGARKRLGNATLYDDKDRALAFDIAVAARDGRAAVSYIDATDIEHLEVNLGRFAILATTMPSTLATVPMLTMAFVLAAMLGAMVLLAGALLVPVHYRGLVRRLRHLPTPSLFERASLRKAWYALAVALCVPLLGIIFVAPGSVEGMLGGTRAPGMFPGLLWGTLLGLVCLVPALSGMTRRELVGDRNAARTWKRVLVAWCGLMLVAFVLAKYHAWTGSGARTLHTEMLDGIVGEGNAALGGLGALLLIAVLGPVFEELVFRGLILGGLARHLSFRWANALQALAFSVAHDDPPRFLFYFAMGLVAGWLVKSTRSLGPAIALHVFNNAVFVLLRWL